MKVVCPNCGNNITVGIMIKKNTNYYCDNCKSVLKPDFMKGVPRSLEPRKRRPLYLNKVCEKLSLSDIIKKDIAELLDEFGTYQTRTEIAGAVYIVCRRHGINVTQKEISDALNVSDVALRTNRDKFLEMMR